LRLLAYDGLLAQCGMAQVSRVQIADGLNAEASSESDVVLGIFQPMID